MSPHREELISKTSPNPNFRGYPSPHILGALTTTTTTILDIPSPHPIAPRKKTRREAKDPHLDHVWNSLVNGNVYLDLSVASRLSFRSIHNGDVQNIVSVSPTLFCTLF